MSVSLRTVWPICEGWDLDYQAVIDRSNNRSESTRIRRGEMSAGGDAGTSHRLAASREEDAT